jgi:ABC-type glutathione transport system ATPase component
VLLIEQNLGVATALADRILVLVNGRVAHEASAPAAGRPRSPAAAPGRGQPRGAVRPTRRRRRRPEQARVPVALCQNRPKCAARASCVPERAHRPRVAADENRSGIIEPAPGPRRGASVQSPRLGAAHVIGTFDTKGRELSFVKSCLERLGIRRSPSTSRPRAASS